jgi:hypothetical protein
VALAALALFLRKPGAAGGGAGAGH